MPITLGSLFDGSGGFPLAGSLCGIVPVWASEVEPYPIAVTKSRFPNMKHLGDISKINGAEIEPVDIISFGSPCQDLSVAGKRAGLKHQAKGDSETTRSGLFMEAIRIIKEMRGATNGKQPQFILFENVPGIFSSNKGEDFRIVLEEFIQIADPSAIMPEVPKGGWPYADSYCGDGWSLAWRVFNAQYWGVAQRRRRLYACLDLGGQRARQILFEREGLRGYFEKSQSPWQGTSANAQGSIGTNDCPKEYLSFHLTQNPIFGDKNTPCLSSGNSANGQAVLGVCYGVDGYNSTLTGEQSSTLGVNCGISSGRCGIIQPIALTDIASTIRAGAGAPKHMSDIVGRLACEQHINQCAVECENDSLVTAYNFDSLSSNSMKSDNPHSGCRQVDVAKTLDTTNPNPNKNQGSTAIVQPVILFEPRSQDGVPRLHNEIAPTLNTAQGGQRQPCVAMPTQQHPFCKSSRPRFKGDSETYIDCKVSNTLNTFDLGDKRANELIVETSPTTYCIQGNCIDRADTAGCNGKGWREDSSFTLNIIDRPAIVYSVDQGGGKSGANIFADISPTLTCTHGGEPAVAHFINKNLSENAKHQEDLLYCLASGQAHAEIYENQAPTLNCTSEQPIITEPVTLHGSPVSGTLMARDYKGVGRWDSLSKAICTSNIQESSQAYHQSGFSGYTEGVGETLKSSGVEYGGESENLITERKQDYIPETIHKFIIENNADAPHQQDLLQSSDDVSRTIACGTHASGPHLTKTVIYNGSRYIVRRLTPTECARLQGFPDRWGWPDVKEYLTDEEYRFWVDVRNTHALINDRKTKDYTKKQMLAWYNKLHSDSSEYKMWGNGVALPPTLYCMQGIYDTFTQQ